MLCVFFVERGMDFLSNKTIHQANIQMDSNPDKLVYQYDYHSQMIEIAHHLFDS